MNLQQKVQQETDVNDELRIQITELNETIKELQDELANRPENKDSASSSSEDKHDFRDEMEKWKSDHEKLTDDFERYKREMDSKYEELTITKDNYHKRNVWLLVLLKKNDIYVDE